MSTKFMAALSGSREGGSSSSECGGFTLMRPIALPKGARISGENRGLSDTERDADPNKDIRSR